MPMRSRETNREFAKEILADALCLACSPDRRSRGHDWVFRNRPNFKIAKQAGSAAPGSSPNNQGTDTH
jgi:hypothetical protein